ncbi:MAG: hypothetical protein HUU38_11740 [Anaerolineales bacterium]|nr:hypothetical protein [Anaerolineales bacterium]
MIVKLRIVLSEDEVHVIQELAEKELRPMKEQIRYLLRQELQRRQLIPDVELPLNPVPPTRESIGGPR